ncbi:MAG TPA: DNA translocase FtsK [Polyangiaceae bacterium]|nr:DNA translocase FtsK [Polyangiaceae bacterium]
MKLPFFSARPEAAAAGPRSARASAGASASAQASPSTLRRIGSTFAREASAVLLFAAALYSLLALATFRADPNHAEIHGADWVGPVGAAFAEIVVTGVGVVAWLIPIELGLVAVPLVSDAEDRPRGLTAWISRIGGDVVVATVAASLVHVAFPSAEAFGAMPVGGAVGELVGEIFRSLFSAAGSFIIGLTVIALVLVGRASFSFIESAKRFIALTRAASDKGATGLRALAAAWVEARAIEAKRAEEENARKSPAIVEEAADAIIAALSDERDEADPGLVDAAPPEIEPPPPAKRARAAPIAKPPPEPEPPPALLDAPTPSPPVSAAKKRGRVAAVVPEDVPTPSPIPPAKPVAPPARDADADRAKVGAKKPKDEGIKIVDTSAAREVEKGDVKVVPAIGDGFRLPLVEFLDPPEGGTIEIHEDQLKETAAMLEKTLSDYGVSGRVEEIHPGPTVTTFEVSPAAGTKVSKVASLADDLALGLSRKVRIIAPIPGKNRIGFEIPNAKRAPVNMKELVEDRRFLEMKAPLPCVMGRDIVGAPYFADLSSMPHVIVAGATGAGKSVGLNVILVSLLYRKTPDELRLLMIDPKVVELAPFDGIPHMLLPVVTDMKQASNALRWSVDEMERRYQMFANAGTKNIITFNAFMEKVIRGEAKAPKPVASKVQAVAADGTETEVDRAKDGSDTEPPKKLPYIVIVVDEFADLMMQQGKDVEASVARLAQKARAAGMHVILATQRPSVDVITGMIKANFPTRVAFRVSQKVDSRTILDEQGAEHLLGRGDMLVKMNGSNDTRRVQCPFISEEETQKVTDFLRLQGKPEYDENILKPRDEDGQVAEEDDAEQDAMYDQAVRIVAETRRCSTSWLQRKLGIGYNRAAKIVESMERRGLVGPANGAKDREVLVEPI